MRLHMVAVAALTGVLVLAGCSGSDSNGTSSSQSQDATSLSADTVLDRYVAAMQPLRTVGSTNGDPETEFRQVGTSLAALVAPLTEGIDGVPDDVAQEAAVATGALAVGIDLLADCLSTEVLIDDCEPLVDNVTTQARTLGSVMADLVPYSNWTAEELTEALG